MAAQVLHVDSTSSKHYSYGTAGFRDCYNDAMHRLFIKVGYIALLRSLSLNGLCIGVMVTASHNPEQDNGVKIVDPDGNMLDPRWEKFCEDVANNSNEALIALIDEKISSIQVSELKASIMIGIDTRDHSIKLCKCIEEGIDRLSQYLAEKLGYDNDNINTFLLGEVSTPQLHYGVWLQNSSIDKDFSVDRVLNSYHSMLLEGYNQVISRPDNSNKARKIIIDCAFGVGSVAMNRLLKYQSSSGNSFGQWQIELRNLNKEGPVNFQCGAEHAQKLQQPPINFDSSNDQGTLLCSLDGDADRIVFHIFEAGEDGVLQWKLLDGDRIATLIALFIQELLLHSKITEDELSVGLVQTAYANGASTLFLKNLSSLQVLTAKTGVKFVHAVAHHQDIGIYFEANGHGTVLFSQKAKNLLESKLHLAGISEEVKQALQKLLGCVKLINQCVGDAISDLLICLAVLEVKDWEATDWLGLYHDLPSKQKKVVVPNKNIFKCSDDEFYLVEPQRLQDQLNIAMDERSNGRCFVRPSGTEDVVRIYAEADSANEANSLCDVAEKAILEVFN